MMLEPKKMIRVILRSTFLIIMTTFFVGSTYPMSNSLLRIFAIPCGHKRISGPRFSPPEPGGFILVGMLLIVYTKIYATYKEHKCERTFISVNESGICSIHTAKEPANVLKKFNAEAKIS